jgi:hypothetical protein
MCLVVEEELRKWIAIDRGFEWLRLSERLAAQLVRHLKNLAHHREKVSKKR